MKDKIVPKWVLQQDGLNLRQWKARKREQIKRVEKAFDEFRNGCAYSPGYREVQGIQSALFKIIDAQSVKNWGR